MAQIKDEPTAGSPPPPPEPPQEAIVPAAATTDAPKAAAPAEGAEEAAEPKVTTTDGPVTDTMLTVDEAEAAVERAEMRFFNGTRQGTEQHDRAKQLLDEARANLRLARRHRRFGRPASVAEDAPADA